MLCKIHEDNENKDKKKKKNSKLLPTFRPFFFF